VRRIPVEWVTHPRHLGTPPKGDVVVVDVAFAADNQWKSKTMPFIAAIGDRLVKWVDHHEHRVGWEAFKNNPRFLLVPNKTAHACPELITRELVDESESARGAATVIVAHCDFDGAVAAVKWRRRGVEPYDGSDEDARAVDSPGRGHTLSDFGLTISRAMDEAATSFGRDGRTAFMTRIVEMLTSGERTVGIDDEIETLAAASARAEEEAERVAEQNGNMEGADVFVVRTDAVIDNRMRRNLLLCAEQRGRIGCVFERDKDGVQWLIAATFDETIDLEDVDGFAGGRSDYRFARASKGGHDLIEKLAAYLASKPR
jgi:hypothetical protein